MRWFGIVVADNEKQAEWSLDQHLDGDDHGKYDSWSWYPEGWQQDARMIPVISALAKGIPVALITPEGEYTECPEDTMFRRIPWSWRQKVMTRLFTEWPTKSAGLVRFHG